MTSNHEKLHEKLMFIIKILLNSMTIFEIDEKIHYFYKYWYLFFTFATSLSILLSEIGVYVLSNTGFEKFLAIQSLGGIFSSNSIFLASQFQSDYLIDTYFMIKNGIRKQSLHHYLEIRNEEVYKQCMFWSRRFGLLIIAFGFNTVLSTIIHAIVTKEYDSRDGMTLIYASRYPWNYNTALTYSFTYIIQVVSVTPVFLLFGGHLAFVTITVIMFQSFTDELADLLRNPDFSENEKTTNEEWDMNYERHLKECIQLHQQIRSNFVKFKSWFDVIFSAEIAYVTIQTGVLSFIILKEEQPIGIAMKLLFFMMVILAQLYFHCNIGEKFYEMNDVLTKTLNDKIFEMNNKKVKRLMLMFIQQTQIPYQLTGFNTFRASLQIFTKLIRTSYGFFNVLRASVK